MSVPRSFDGKKVTTRLANILEDEEVASLAELEAILRSGRFRFFKNAGQTMEVEAKKLCGLQAEKIVVCRYCGDSHVCVPKLKSVPRGGSR